jgi:hypothetical protein
MVTDLILDLPIQSDVDESIDPKDREWRRAMRVPFYSAPQIADPIWEEMIPDVLAIPRPGPSATNEQVIEWLVKQGLKFSIPACIDVALKRHIFTYKVVAELTKLARKATSHKDFYAQAIENYQLKESQYHQRRDEIIADVAKRHRWPIKKATEQWKTWFADPRRAPSFLKSELQEMSRDSRNVEVAHKKSLKSAKKYDSLVNETLEKVRDFFAGTKLCVLVIKYELDLIKCARVLHFCRALKRDYDHPKKPILTEPYCHLPGLGLIIDEEVIFIENARKCVPTPDGMQSIGGLIHSLIGFRFPGPRLFALRKRIVEIMRIHARWINDEVTARLDEEYDIILNCEKIFQMNLGAHCPDAEGDLRLIMNSITDTLKWATGDVMDFILKNYRGT